MYRTIGASDRVVDGFGNGWQGSCGVGVPLSNSNTGDSVDGGWGVQTVRLASTWRTLAPRFCLVGFERKHEFPLRIDHPLEDITTLFQLSVIFLQNLDPVTERCGVSLPLTNLGVIRLHQRKVDRQWDIVREEIRHVATDETHPNL